MKKLLIITLFIISSCNNNKRINIDDELIKKLSIENFDSPSEYNMYYLFAKCTNSEIVQTDILQLRILYKKNKQSMSFYDFLTHILNQKTSLQKSADIECFQLDKKITEEYKAESFQKFLLTHFEKTKTGNYILKTDTSSGIIKTIFYYCFINNYLAIFDDYAGFYYIKKI